MSTVINTNLASLYAQNNLTNAQGALAQSVQRLSSGLRINSARDDAAGLSIAQNMQSQINGLSQSVRNLNDATNLLQTADSSLATIQDMLLRLKQLSVQGYDSSLSATQRTNIVTEMKDLNSEINATATRTKFNGISLLGSSMGVSTPLSDIKKDTYLSDTAAMWAFTDGDIDLGAATDQDVGTDTTTNAWFEITHDINSDAYAKMAGVIFTLNYNSSGNSLTMSAVSDWDNTGDTTVFGTPQTVNVADALGAESGLSDVDREQVLDFSNFGIKIHLTTTVTAGDAKVLGSAIAKDLDLKTIEHTVDEATGAAVKITNVDTSGVENPGTYTLEATGDEVTTTYVDSNGESQTHTLTLMDSQFLYSGTTNTIDVGFGIKVSLYNFQTTTAGDVAGWLAATDSGFTFDGDGSGDATGQIVVSGNSNSRLEFQSGANSSAYITVNTINVGTDSNGSASEMQDIGTGITTGDTALANLGTNDSVATWQASFKSLESSIDTALDYISEQRATIGSQMNRLSYIISNLGTQSVNTQNSRSAIIDTDFAAETAKLTKGQIMQQAATAMLAQANQMPNVILSLLK